MLEPLEDKVKKFAEQSRDRLLEEIRIKKGKDTVEAVWQGFASDGQAQVKYDNEIKKVRGLGNANKIRGQKVLVDKAKTAEYEKVDDKPKEPKVKGAEIVRAQVPTREDMLMPLQMPLGGEEEKVWVLAYVTHANPTHSYASATAEIQSSFANYTSDSDSDTTPADANASTYGRKFHVHAAAAIATAYFGTVSASSTGVSSASASSSGQHNATRGVSYSYGLTDGSHSTAPLSASVTSSPDGTWFQLNGGLGMAKTAVLNVTLPNGNLYLEWTNMGQGVEPIKINLNNITPSDIWFQKIIHLFCKRNNSGDVIAFVTLEAGWGDVSQSQVDTYTGVNFERQDVGYAPQTYGLIHLKVNLSTRSLVDSKITVVETPDQYGPFGVSLRAGWGDPNIGVSATATLYNPQFTVNIAKNIKAITECYSDDWMYPFRGTQFDSTAQANLDKEEIYGFLSCSYEEEVETYWYGFQSICPKVTEYNSDTLGIASFWVPPETSGWYGNSPNYGNYQDIEGLSPTIRLSTDSFQLQYDNFYSLNASWTDSSVYGYRRMSPVLPVTTEVRWGLNSSTSLGFHGDDIQWDFFMSRTYRP